MTLPILLVLLLIVGTLMLFVSERFSVGVSALIVLAVTMFLGVLMPESFPNVKEGLSGFANTATITILCMFILTAGLERTGLLQLLSRKSKKFIRHSHLRFLVFLILIVAPVSAIINNTAIVAILIPFVLTTAHKNHVHATKLMIPLSGFAMLGGMLTLLGSSTNILANSLLEDFTATGEGLGIFSITMVGGITLVVGMIYFLTLGKWLLPDRPSPQEHTGMQHFLLELVIEDDNKFIGKKVGSSKFRDHYGVKIEQVICGQKFCSVDVREHEIKAGDTFLVRASERSIGALLEQEHIQILHNFGTREPKRPFAGGKLVRAVFISKFFQHRLMKQVDFLRNFGVTPIGVGKDVSPNKRLQELKLRTGQEFLLYVTERRFEKFKNSIHFLFLDTLDEQFQPKKIVPVLLILSLVVLIPALTGVPIVVTALMGVVMMLLTRCITAEEMFGSVHWNVIFLIAGLVPLGIAVQKSGLGTWFTELTLPWMSQLSVFWVLILFYGITTLLTELLSNTATIVLMLPLALPVAVALGIDVRIMTVVLMFAASMSMMTPFGYQTNAMVYQSANYQAKDFFVVGFFLKLILMFVTVGSVLLVF